MPGPWFLDDLVDAVGPAQVLQGHQADAPLRVQGRPCQAAAGTRVTKEHSGLQVHLQRTRLSSGGRQPGGALQAGRQARARAPRAFRSRCGTRLTYAASPALSNRLPRSMPGSLQRPGAGVIG